MKSVFLLCVLIYSMGSIAQVPDRTILQQKAPETFKVAFKTTRGVFVVKAFRKWSPLGVDRFYQLIKTNFFTDALLFRVELNYVVQFGISASYPMNRFWDPRKIMDEPARAYNKKGFISFARDGANNRATQFFINMADNPKLDTMVRNGAKGYPPIGQVVMGMEVIAGFNGRYGKKPALLQDSLYKYGNVYFETLFPGLDRILSTTLFK